MSYENPDFLELHQAVDGKVVCAMMRALFDVDMGFFQSAWNWVRRATTSVWSRISSMWDWVKNQVTQAWHILSKRSLSFGELFSLKLLAQNIRSRIGTLWNRLSAQDQRELRDLLMTIDAQ
jgi:hypothetical protein